MRVVQMCTFTFTFLKASKVIIYFQYFTYIILSQFPIPILHKPFFLFGTESTMWLRKLKGWLVGVWDGTNLGWIPTGGLYPNFIPKSQWSGGVVQFCLDFFQFPVFLHIFYLFLVFPWFSVYFHLFFRIYISESCSLCLWVIQLSVISFSSLYFLSFPYSVYFRVFRVFPFISCISCASESCCLWTPPPLCQPERQMCLCHIRPAPTTRQTTKAVFALFTTIYIFVFFPVVPLRRCQFFRTLWVGGV